MVPSICTRRKVRFRQDRHVPQGAHRKISLASAVADALRRRGIGEPAASLTAEAGIAIFKIAFERWINETSQRDLPQLIRESLHQLKAVTAGT